MATLPDYMRLTEQEAAELKAIQDAAKIRHEKARKAAKAQGRRDFPDLPYECSWAYEEEFRREGQRGRYSRDWYARPRLPSGGYMTAQQFHNWQ